NTIQITVRKKKLVWRMDLDEPDAKLDDLFHILMHVRGMFRMHTAARDQTFWIGLAVVRYPLVDSAGKSHHLRRNVIDEHRAIKPNGIHICQQGLRIAAELKDIVITSASTLHHLKRGGLEHRNRLDVDVAVGDEQGRGPSVVVVGRRPTAEAEGRD